MEESTYYFIGNVDKDLALGLSDSSIDITYKLVPLDKPYIRYINVNQAVSTLLELKDKFKEELNIYKHTYDDIILVDEEYIRLNKENIKNKISEFKKKKLKKDINSLTEKLEQLDDCDEFSIYLYIEDDLNKLKKVIVSLDSLDEDSV